MGSNSKLEALRKREAELKAQIANIEEAEKAKQRKEDTRLKVLVGAAFLADIEKHPDTRATVAATLNRAITSDKDRAFLKAKGWL